MALLTLPAAQSDRKLLKLKLQTYYTAHGSEIFCIQNCCKFPLRKAIENFSNSNCKHISQRMAVKYFAFKNLQIYKWNISKISALKFLDWNISSIRIQAFSLTFLLAFSIAFGGKRSKIWATKFCSILKMIKPCSKYCNSQVTRRVTRQSRSRRSSILRRIIHSCSGKKIASAGRVDVRLVIYPI